MSSSVIRREQAHAVLPWQPSELLAPAPSLVAVVPAGPSAQEIAALYEQTRREAYAEGLAAGRADARAEALRLEALVLALQSDLQRVEQEVAAQVLDLALELARQMLRQALAIRPELVLAVVRESIGLLPLAEGARLALHPEDADLVRLHLAEAIAHGHWLIDEDTHLERGECRIETATNLVDGHFPTRWEQLGVALGKNSDWLMPDAAA